MLEGNMQCLPPSLTSYTSFTHFLYSSVTSQRSLSWDILFKIAILFKTCSTLSFILALLFSSIHHLLLYYMLYFLHSSLSMATRIYAPRRLGLCWLLCSLFVSLVYNAWQIVGAPYICILQMHIAYQNILIFLHKRIKEEHKGKQLELLLSL